MTFPARKQPAPPHAPAPASRAFRAGVAQPMKTFDAIRTANAGGRRGSAGEELVPSGQDVFQVRQADRGVMVRPNGTYNFVRVAGETQARAQTLISSKAGHAAIAGGRPVLYAGTVRFDNGALDWWSNYSGTYQPIAAFRAQASLPEDRFMPWQRLQMGGIGMQRNTFRDQRKVLDPEKPKQPQRSQPDTAKAAAEPVPQHSTAPAPKKPEPIEVKGASRARPVPSTPPVPVKAATATAQAKRVIMPPPPPFWPGTRAR